MKNLLMALLAGFIVCSCTAITSKGLMVDVKEKITAKDMEEYNKVGEVACLQTVFLVTRAHNRSLCLENLRNSAAELGGDFVVVDQETKLPGVISTGCELKASVYKSKKTLNNSENSTDGVQTK